jgi:hypothetical protein
MTVHHSPIEVRCQAQAWPGVFNLMLFDAGFNLVLEEELKNETSFVQVSVFNSESLDQILNGVTNATWSYGLTTFQDFFLVMPQAGDYIVMFKHSYSFVAPVYTNITVLPGAPVSIRVVSLKNVYVESLSKEDDLSLPQIIRLKLLLLDGSGTRIDRPAQLEFNIVPPPLFMKTNTPDSPDVIVNDGAVDVDISFKHYRDGSPISLFIHVNFTKSNKLLTEATRTRFDVFNVNQPNSSILTPNYRKLVVDSNFGHPLFSWKETFDTTFSELAAFELCNLGFSNHSSECTHRNGSSKLILGFPNMYPITEIEKISVKGCHNLTQFPTPTGICACRATWYRSKPEETGSSSECAACELNQYRSPSQPWKKFASFEENRCDICPLSTIIRKHEDRYTHKNCRCEDNYFFQYRRSDVVNPQRKRGICSYSELPKTILPDQAICTCALCELQDPPSAINEKSTNCTEGYFGLLPGFATLKSHMLGPGDSSISALLNGNISDQVFKCKRPEACINNGTCNAALGYTGVLCAECVPGFGLMAQNKCGKCLPVELNRFVVSCMGLGLLFVIVIMAYGSKAPASDMSAIQKILVNHLSVLSFIGQMSLAWGSIFNDYVFSGASVTSDVSTASPIDCVFVGDFRSKFFVWMSFPVIGLLIPAVFNTFQYQFTRHIRKLAVKSSLFESLLGNKSTRIIITETAVTKAFRMPQSHAVSIANRNRVLRAAQDDEDARELRVNSLLIFFVSLYFFYPMLTKMIFDSINVLIISPLRDIPEVTIYRLDAIPSVDPTQFDYKAVIIPTAIFFLIIYGIFIPASLILAMRWKQEARLGGGSMTIIFNFMTQGYRFETYYWESYVMVRKLIISAVIAFLSRNSLYQSYGLLAVMIINLILTIFLKPYKAVQGWALDLASTTVLHITILAGIILTSTYDPNLPLSEQAKLLAVTILALLFNFVIILVLIAFVVYDNLRGKELGGVPLILYFRYYSPWVRQEIRQLRQSHANFIATLQSKTYNKLPYNKFLALTAKDSNAIRRAYHKRMSLASTFHEKQLASVASLYELSLNPNIEMDDEVGRLANSSSELTVTPSHSSSESDTQRDFVHSSGSMSTESSDARLSDSDDSLNAVSQDVPVRQFTAPSAWTKQAVVNAPRIASGVGKISSNMDDVSSKSSPEGSFKLPNERIMRSFPLFPVQQPTIESHISPKSAPSAAAAGVPDAAIPQATRQGFRSNLKSSLSNESTEGHRRSSSVSSPRVETAFSRSAPRNPDMPPSSTSSLKTLERPPSPTLSVASFRSARIIRALPGSGNSTASVALPLMTSNRGDDALRVQSVSQQVSRNLNSAQAPALAATPANHHSTRESAVSSLRSPRSTSRPLHSEAQAAASFLNEPPPPFPIDLLTPRDLPPPLPLDFPKQRVSTSNVAGIMRESSPLPPPPYSQPSFPEAPKAVERRSYGQHRASAHSFEKDE